MAVNSKSGVVIAGNDADKNLYVFDPKSGAQTLKIVTEMKRICSIAVSPDGTRIVAADNEGKIKSYDAASGKSLNEFTGHKASVFKVSFSPDGKQFLSLGLDQVIRVWDIATGKELAAIVDNSIPGLVAEFMPNGYELLIESSPKAIIDQHFQLQIVNWNTSTISKTLRLPQGWYQMPWDAALDPSGKSVVVAGLDKSLLDFDLTTGKPTRMMESRADVIADIALTEDGKSLVVAGKYGAMSVFDLGTNTLTEVSVPLSGSRLPRANLSATSDLLLADFGDIKQFLIDPKTGKFLRTVETDMTAAYQREEVLGTPNQTWFGPGGVILVRYGLSTFACDAKTGKQIGSFDGNLDGLEILKPLTEDQGEVSDYIMVHSSHDGITLAMYGLGPKFFLKDEFGAGKLRTLEGHTEVVNGLDFSKDGKIVVTGSRDQTVKLWDTASGKETRTISGFGGRVLHVKFVANDQYILTNTIDGRGFLHRTSDGSEVAATKGKLDAATNLVVTPDGKRMIWIRENNSDFYRTGDASAHIMELATGRELGQIMLFRNGDWAVLDGQGRYDANDPSGLEGLYWLVGDEAIGLGQFKSMYYDPGLLGKLLGSNPEPLRDVVPLTRVALYPAVEATLAADAASATVKLTNRGGGMGLTEVRLNGALITSLNPPDPSAKEHVFVIKLTEPGLRARLLPKKALEEGQENRLDVVAYNKDAYLASRSRSVAVPAPETEIAAPKLYVIVAGVSDYKGTELDLRYAAADAKNMAEAFELAGTRWLGATSVKVRRFASESGSSEAEAATKANIQAAFAAVAKDATSTDIVVVYLAGHGVNQGGNVDDYFFLTGDAETAELTIPEVRERVAIGGNELGEWLAAIPTGKQVLILDTCASGKVAADLSAQRDVPSDVVRSWERLKDRSGVFILAGCASDAVSYEASTYGQGLLTYALLEAMAKDDGALRRDPSSSDGRAFVDVMGIYQRAADRVPDLVRQIGIGGIQRPEIKTRGNAASFDIGVLNREDRGRIPLAIPRPVILRPSFEEQDQPEDPLDLTQAVENELRSASSRGKEATIAFWDVSEHIGCYRVRGRYSEKDGQATVTVYLSRMEMVDGKLRPKALGDFQVSGASKESASLAKKILTEIETRVKANPG